MPGIDECLLETMTLPGALGASLVDWSSGLALGTMGDSPVGDHETTAAETAELARSAAEFDSFTAIGEGLHDEPAVEDLIVTTRAGYHIIRFVQTSFDSSVFLHVWLDRDSGNLALARMRLRGIAERLVLG
ncbi:hypothetical protein ACFW2Y_20980 [Streptomyces sp. NPDC058877]|uniref:hypothetical protein n=1 Tax=unclassified Streptomyces TaxID=2593676 RepID=UPI0036BBAFFC